MAATLTEEPKRSRFSWVKKLIRTKPQPVRAVKHKPVRNIQKHVGQQSTVNDGDVNNGTTNCNEIVNYEPCNIYYNPGGHSYDNTNYTENYANESFRSSFASSFERTNDFAVDYDSDDHEDVEPQVLHDDNLARNPHSSASLSRSTTSMSDRQTRVQIVDSRPHRGDAESLGSSSKRRSNSNFTVPSISRTSITTVSPSLSDNASTHTVPSLSTVHQNHLHHNLHSLMDAASVITIASSSKKHHRRSSFDTNASTRAIAPESILSRTSIDSSSFMAAPTKSIASSDMRLRRDDD
jgi:hypothetical protein